MYALTVTIQIYSQSMPAHMCVRRPNFSTTYNNLERPAFNGLNQEPHL